MPINVFEDQLEYEQHVKSTTESEVSYITDLQTIEYDGINVHVTSPKFGDAVYIDDVLDENDQYRKHFIDGASLNPTLLPNTWTPVGVVVDNDRNNVLIAYYKGYNNGDNTQCWCNSALFQIDAIIDGSSHNIVFQQRKSADPSVWITIGTFTYSSSSEETFVQDLDTWLRANPGFSSGDNKTLTYDWHCEYMENYAGIMKPFVICDTISDYRQYSTIIANGDATATLTETDNLQSVEKYKRVNTSNSERVGINYQRLLEYYNTNTTISNLTSDISITNANDIVSRVQFNENIHCANLRNVYGTFEEYIKSIMLLYPTLKQGLGIEYNKSLEWTKTLTGKKHKNKAGTDVITFPCHDWVQSIGFNSTGLELGKWYLPSCNECRKINQNLTYALSGININNCDQLNKTLYKMNGTLIHANRSFWSCVKRSRTHAWFLNSYGTFTYYTNNMSNRNRVVAVSLLTL